MRKPFLLLAAATMLSGCANLAPPHTRPPLSTAPDYPEGFANDVTLGQRATEISWHDFFADPQLEVLVARALERNRDLAVAVARIDEAKGLYRIQDADRLPTVGASADATRSRAFSAFTTPPGSTRASNSSAFAVSDVRSTCCT